MNLSDDNKLEDIYPACRAILGPEGWRRLMRHVGRGGPGILSNLPEGHVVPDFLPDLARLEWCRHVAATSPEALPTEAGEFAINPTLEVLQLSWHVTALVTAPEDAPAPRPGEEWALIRRDPFTGEVRVETADESQLLVLKVVADGLPLEQAAVGGLTVGQVEAAMLSAVEDGILIGPPSEIRREPEVFPQDPPREFLAARGFVLQWHITHACDLHCRHCYDRTKRGAPPTERALAVLEDLHAFCRSKHVRGHVCFTGGNPFLYEPLFDVYRAAHHHGFSTSILGNPVPRDALEKLIEIRMPGYYQTSLEGLPEHNDTIRGKGHFASVIVFLGVLRDLGISSAIMLTLTKDNMGQVLPLAERLRGHTDHFTFSRLSPVGEGADLLLPSREEYEAFLESYVTAADGNPILGLKDNLINIVRHRRGRRPFDGCTGYGCGAAFNFLALLPDGEVHACRKFSSPLGNAYERCLADIYDSDLAQRYRRGSEACRGCRLRPTCGGCLAVTSGHGLDIFAERDPHCFMETPS